MPHIVFYFSKFRPVMSIRGQVTFFSKCRPVFRGRKKKKKKKKEKRAVMRQPTRIGLFTLKKELGSQVFTAAVKMAWSRAHSPGYTVESPPSRVATFFLD